MKKIKKFKIIEEGRICSPEEMKEIVGGYMCSDGNSLTVCPTDWFLASCQPAAASGYYEDFCGQPLPQTLQVCTEDYKYDVCVLVHYTCGAENTYMA